MDDVLEKMEDHADR